MSEFSPPAKTPQDIVKVLEAALAKALARKPPRRNSSASGAELASATLQTSKGFGDYIKAEYANTKEAARLAGITPQ